MRIGVCSQVHWSNRCCVDSEIYFMKSSGYVCSFLLFMSIYAKEIERPLYLLEP
jgi:hypothetical protein